MKAQLKLGAAIIALAVSASAQAADHTGKSDPHTLDIIVTANKRAEPNKDVPLSVSVVDAAQIAQAHVRDLFDITSMVPAFRIDQHEASSQTNFLIRGFGNGDNNVGIEPSVGVFIDGVYRSRSASQISDLADVVQIEIFEGPQTTLFGKNASAGVISISTQEPQFKFGGTAEATYSNFNGTIFKASVTGPLSQTVAASLTGSFDRDDGYARNLSKNTLVNNRHRWAIKGQLLWTPSKDFKLRIIADADRLNEQCCAVLNLKPSDATQLIQAVGGNVNAASQSKSDNFYSNFNPTNDIRNHGLSAQATYAGSSYHITSISAWREMQSYTNEDADFTSADLLSNYSQQQKIRTITQEVRFSSDFDGPFNFLAGAYYFNENIKQSNTVQWGSQMRNYADGLIQGLSAQMGSPTTLSDVENGLSGVTGQNLTGQFFAPGQGQFQNYRLQNSSASLFAQADLKPSERLTLTAGINLTRDTKHFSTNISSTDVFSNLDLPSIANAAIGAGLPADQALGLVALMPLQLFPSSPALPNSIEPGRTANTHASWTARIGYKIDPAISAYANISTGFKPSSINLSRDSRPAISDASAMIAAGLAPAPTVNVAGVPISTGAYGSRFNAPETSILYEIGLKGRWKKASFNLALFKEIVKDFQSVVFTGTGFYLQNAGQESNWGVEANGSLQPTPNLTLSAAMAWYHPRYDSFENSSVGDLTGTRPANIAPFSMTLAAQHSIILKNGNKIKSRLSWHYEASTKIIEGLPGEIVRDPITQQVISYQPAMAAADEFKRTVHQLDGSIAYLWRSNIEFSVWARNLTNNRYLIGVIDSPAQSGSVSGYYNRPRTYGLTAAVKW